MNTIIRLASITLSLITAAPLFAAPPQVILHADAAATSSVYHRAIDNSTIGAAASAGTVGADLRDILTLRSPDSASVAYITLNASGQLAARLRTDSGVGTETAVATSVPVSTPSPWSAAYLSPSGALVFAYATTGSSTCWARTLTGTSLSTAVATPLSLSSTPAKVRVAARPGSNEVLIVAQDSSLRLAATVWNGSTFRATATIDAAYSGGVNRWDCAWTRAGEAIILRANSGSTSLTATNLVNDTWTALASAPTAAAAIARVIAAEDPRQPGGGLAVGTLTSSGILEVTTRAAGTWSSPVQVATAVDTSLATPAALAFEGTGGGLVAAWLIASSEQARTSRKTLTGSWSNAALSSSLGTGLQGVTLTPRDDADGVVLTARRTSTAAADPFGSASGYVVYAKSGSISDGDRNTYTGLVGANVSGVSLPTAPTGTAGTTNVTLSHDGSTTIAPGNYRDLSFGDRCTINFSAGTYVFRRIAATGHDARFNFNTNAGSVSVIILQASTEWRDRYTITNTGPGTVTFHFLSSLTKIGHDANIAANLVFYNSGIEVSDRFRITGRILASSSITIGHDGVFTLVGGSPGGSSGSSTHRLHALLVSAGSVGSATELTSADFTGTAPPPLAVTAPAVRSTVRVVRWQETAP